MTDIAIRVENLSKQYRIGARQAAYRTLREALTDAVAAPFRRKRNPNLEFRNPHSEYIWALKDVSFEVQRGEVVGIPSLRQAQYKRQAQDKHWAQRSGEDHAYFDRLSTRLKILSRITEPTEGRAEIHGRVCSLSEVGIGFHSELIGQENII
jgi:lipopolysaccharide transport system ATP-binding protein